MYAIIVGNGKVGGFIRKQLLQKDFEVKTIEKYEKNVDSDDVGVVIGDACDIKTLEFMKADQASLMIVVTGEDHTNLVVSLLGKTQFGIPKIISRINNPDNKWLFTKSWGVDSAVSMPDAMIIAIKNELHI